MNTRSIFRQEPAQRYMVVSFAVVWTSGSARRLPHPVSFLVDVPPPAAADRPGVRYVQVDIHCHSGEPAVEVFGVVELGLDDHVPPFVDKAELASSIGIPHDVRGNVINTYVILRSGFSSSPELAEELIQHVGKEVGPIAKPAVVEFVESLPKTRSGKIMRRLLKARALGLPEGDTTTLEA